ncbi:response regulator [Actinoplanes palleronii]|uniref:Response regulator n=1 Tax=Actinoplanes palleronii TaxID=113570 RepID=A0ABQ4BMJ2_9ACTN|nr:response regulator [Actinoplanes palleronii]GIE71850.1 response regulator [Actinoplanes palleronii]
MTERRSVLVVEDNEIDLEVIVRALRRWEPDLRVDALADGDEVVPWLLRAVRLPRLMLLDLGLVGRNGRAVLRDIRREPVLAELAVVVLTSSTDPRDVDECYAAGANGYLVKSIDIALLQSTLIAGVTYWMRHPIAS